MCSHSTRTSKRLEEAHYRDGDSFRPLGKHLNSLSISAGQKAAAEAWKTQAMKAATHSHAAGMGTPCQTCHPTPHVLEPGKHPLLHQMQMLRFATDRSWVWKCSAASGIGLNPLCWARAPLLPRATLASTVPPARCPLPLPQSKRQFSKRVHDLE